MNDFLPDLKHKSNTLFTHIYIEETIQDHPFTKRMLARFPNAIRIKISHYKDIFNRSGQNYMEQKLYRSLILAKTPATSIYPGGVVCQSFGNEHFYYTSSVMNCIYDCEYCYLQGMYPSANIVVFVDLESVFAKVDELLKQHPVYLCISYDTDLLALDGLLGFLSQWHDFAKKRPSLTLEVRTKSANISALKKLLPLPNLIFAWTLSPQPVITACEHATPSLKARINAIQTAISNGHPVRLCFDPLIYHSNASEVYTTFLHEVFAQICADSVKDVSVGTFRISKEYLKQMRRNRPQSAVVQYPYVVSDGYYHYSTSISHELTDRVLSTLKQYVTKEQIFLWEDTL